MFNALSSFALFTPYDIEHNNYQTIFRPPLGLPLPVSSIIQEEPAWIRRFYSIIFTYSIVCCSIHCSTSNSISLHTCPHSIQQHDLLSSSMPQMLTVSVSIVRCRRWTTTQSHRNRLTSRQTRHARSEDEECIVFHTLTHLHTHIHM